MTLFRLVNPTEGSVRIDGIDIGVLNLTELRRRIAIIPQVGRVQMWCSHSRVYSSLIPLPPSSPLRRSL
jgi:ABC-type cobalamin/Fe3+-siderophores transport system ATPase subunit